jgi:CRP/FNR family transcriptional regulator, cyclic AMP receptor protein
MATYATQRLRAFGISEAAAYKVAPTLSLSSLSAGDVVCSAAASTKAWRLIIDGFVGAVIPSVKEGGEVQNIYGPESWFGEQSILNSADSYIEYVCITDVELLNMPASTFLWLLDEEPGFAKCAARLTSWRAQRDAEMLMLAKAGNPALRTVLGLGMFFEAVAAKSDRPNTENLVDSLTLPVGQHVLAQLCGVSRTSLWENVSRLEDGGWLKVHYGKLELFGLSTWRTVMRRRRESRSVRMNPTIDELLSEFVSADLVQPNPESPRVLWRPVGLSQTDMTA